MPPLRDRLEDIPELVEFFPEKYSAENNKPTLRISDDALRRLLDYAWPENVRELENVVERAVVLSSAPVIGIDLLGEDVNYTSPEHNPSLGDIVADCEHCLVTDILSQCRGNCTETARHLNVPISTLRRKMKRLKIELTRDRNPALLQNL